MSKSRKLLSLLVCVVVLGIIGYLIVPFVLLKYVNGMMLGVHVNVVSLKSLDCVNLKGISINRGNINGNIISAVACRNSKTVIAYGGSVTIKLGSGISGSNNSTGEFDKYRIICTNLSLKVLKDDSVLQLENVGVDGPIVSAPSGTATFKYGKLTFENIDINRNSKAIKIGHAKTFQDGIGDINVYGIKSSIDSKSINVGIDNIIIKHDENLSIRARDVIITFLPYKFVQGSAKKVLVSNPVLFSDTLSVEDIEVAPFPISDVKTTDHLIGIRGITFNANIAKKRVIGKGSCKEWLRALPPELKISQIDQVKFKGDMKFSIELIPDVKFKLHNGCMIDGPAPEFIKALSSTFKYTAYHPNSGGTFERTSGPGSPEWVPFKLVSDTMVKALTTTEDPGFFSHRGIIPQAIENSIKDNLRLGRFFRGGSTITMQLVKNLWLSRKRTLGRKIQEAILTVALESSLPKEKILELYLNVVEFGPDLYGIGPGANKLLGTPPSNITLSQALYLVLRLPAPSRSGTYEQMKGKIAKMLDLMTTSGKVTEEEAGYEKAFLFEDFNDEN